MPSRRKSSKKLTFTMHSIDLKDSVQILRAIERPKPKWLNIILKRNPEFSKENTETALRLVLWSYIIFGIFNADETGLRTCTKSGLILEPKAKYVKDFCEITMGSEKENFYLRIASHEWQHLQWCLFLVHYRTEYLPITG